MITYEQAIRCPRCGKDGNARTNFTSDPVLGSDKRVTSVFCADKTCPFYGRFWYFEVSLGNEVLTHTHTPYTEPAA